MSIGADVLASTLVDLAPGFSELFLTWHPLLKVLKERKHVDFRTLQGPFHEFTITTGGVGATTEVAGGSEEITGGRRQNAQRGDTYAPRLIHAWDVPLKDLAEANGEQDLARIIDDYPMLALDEWQQQLVQQLATGAGNNGLSGFPTFNGDATFNPGGVGARAGFFEFAATGSQSNVVHNLNSATVAGWENQYGDIASFPLDGRSTLRQEFLRAGRQGKALGKVDVMFADEQTYLNYIEDLDDQVQVAKVTGDMTPGDLGTGVPFLQSATTMFLEEAIDINDAAFTTAGAQNGVCYGLNSKTWHAYALGHESGGPEKETKGMFELRGPFRIPTQDVIRFEYVLMMGLYCRNRRANFVVTGGARP
jgi:hypothetical protein